MPRAAAACEIDVDRPAATDDDQPQGLRGGDDPLREGGHLGDGDLDAGHEAQHQFLSARRLLHLGHRPERLHRPAQINLTDRQPLPGFSAEGVAQQGVEDELVAGDQRRHRPVIRGGMGRRHRRALYRATPRKQRELAKRPADAAQFVAERKPGMRRREG